MKILLIEDDLDDVELLQDTFNKYETSYKMDVVNDGNAAVEFIRSSKESPDLIILDFNLPKVHGRDVIIEIKATPSFKNVPLLILTTSSSKEDIDYAYKHGADKYLIKPSNLKQIKEMYDVIIELAKK